MDSSDLESSSSSSCTDQESSLSDEGNVESYLFPYQDEPLADAEDSIGTDSGEEDLDGLSPSTLERRFDKTDPVQSWCTCGHCKDEYLVSALEHRCCKEVDPVGNLLMFDGSVENINCITKHADFDALTNKTVLKQVAPLLRDKQGRRYRRQPGRSENELLRATAYRWLVRWLCGYLGWENTRPLPACVYHIIRTRIPTHNITGYASAQDRDT